MLHATFRNQLHRSIDPLLIRSLERAITKAQLHLSEPALDTAHAEGEKMSIDQAIDVALKTLDEI
jgi:hypothetical protein